MRKFEPDVLAEQESIKTNAMPDDTKVAVIPLGQIDEALEYEMQGKRKVVSGVKNHYIHEVE